MLRVAIASLASVLTFGTVCACQQSSVGSASDNMTDRSGATGDPCESSADCNQDFDFCAFADGCGAPGELGTCEPLAHMCYAPGGDASDMVCGCDGVTYASWCYANEIGVNVEHEGACDDGGLWTFCVEDVCDALVEVCLFQSGCGEVGSFGYCASRPVSCPMVILPVCGCDDVTYDNECKAHAFGVTVQHEGECGEV